VILHHRIGERSAISVGPVLALFAWLVLAMTALVVAIALYTAIAVASVAGGAYLARRRPDLGGFRRHSRALWRGLTARLS